MQQKRTPKKRPQTQYFLATLPLPKLLNCLLLFPPTSPPSFMSSAGRLSSLYHLALIFSSMSPLASLTEISHVTILCSITCPLFIGSPLSLILVLSLPSTSSHTIAPVLSRCGRSEERRVGKECLRLCRSRWSPYH